MWRWRCRTSRASPRSSVPTGSRSAATGRRPWLPAGWPTGRSSSFQLAEGRPPEPGAATEVVIDRASAERGDLHVGDHTSVLTPDRIPVTVVGIVTFGDDDSLGPTSYVGFDLADGRAPARRRRPAASSSVLVRAAERRQRRRAGGPRPPGDGSRRGDSRRAGADRGRATAEQQADVDSAFLGLFRTMLLAFAGIAVVVAAFSIHNTFSILVAQRTRESALMRAIGAVAPPGRRRCRRPRRSSSASSPPRPASPPASGIAAGLLALMSNSDLALPHAELVIGTSSIVAAAVVGIGTTMLASLGPAIRASRVAPLAALRDVAVDRSASSTKRAVAGIVLIGRRRRRDRRRDVEPGRGDGPGRPRRARRARRCRRARPRRRPPRGGGAGRRAGRAPRHRRAGWRGATRCATPGAPRPAPRR